MGGNNSLTTRGRPFMCFIYRSRRSCKGQVSPTSPRPRRWAPSCCRWRSSLFPAARRSKLGPVLSCLVSLRCAAALPLCSVCVGEDKDKEEEEEEEEGSHDAGDGRQPQKETTVGDSTASQLLTGTGLCARTRARGWSSGGQRGSRRGLVISLVSGC